jgi:hypothetical protein
MQFDFPLTNNRVTYSEQTTQPGFTNSQVVQNLVRQFPGQVLLPPFAATSGIEEQILMHVDAGVGYWLVRNPSARYVFTRVIYTENHDQVGHPPGQNRPAGVD